MRVRSMTIPMILFVLLTACGETVDENRPAPPIPGGQAQTVAPSEAGATPGEPTGGVVTLAGIGFMPPEDWRDLGPNQMRKASYEFGPLDGDDFPAEVTVFYFGEGQGGEIEANLRRWIGQMQTPDGGDAAPTAIRSKLTNGVGLDIHFVEVNGTFMRSMGGGPMTGGRTKPFPGYRMVGGIVEAPQGNVFFKLIGPDNTARAMEAGFREMLAASVKLYEGD